MNKKDIIQVRQKTVDEVINDGGGWLNARGFHNTTGHYSGIITYTTNEEGYFDRFRVIMDHDGNTIVCFPCGMLYSDLFVDFIIKQMKRYKTQDPNLSAWYFIIWHDDVQSQLDGELKSSNLAKLVIKGDVDKAILENDKEWLDPFSYVNNLSFTPKDKREEMINMINMLREKMIDYYKNPV